LYVIVKVLKIFKDGVIITVTQKDSRYMAIIEINPKADACRLGWKCISEISEDGGKKQGKKSTRGEIKCLPGHRNYEQLELSRN
jgi:hypothetical protein